DDFSRQVKLTFLFTNVNNVKDFIINDENYELFSLYLNGVLHIHSVSIIITTYSLYSYPSHSFLSLYTPPILRIPFFSAN
ncbi:17663_t:CDS:1, partial [Dentiscutata erythropus]